MTKIMTIAQQLLSGDTTVSVDGTVPDHGYCVADHGISGTDLAFADVLVFLDSEPTATYFGSWHDSNDGRLYLDVVDVIDDIDTATKIASERNEIAIFDLGSFTEIRV